MKYLRLFNSHSNYESKNTSLPKPCVISDGEHVHYIKNEETTVTEYKIIVQTCVENSDTYNTYRTYTFSGHNVSINVVIPNVKSYVILDENGSSIDESNYPVTVTLGSDTQKITSTSLNYNVIVRFTIEDSIIDDDPIIL